MSKLHIADNLSLPLDAVTQTFGILGKRGGGKSYTAKVMAEEMIRSGAHVCGIDPIGNWWGLRVAADGKSPGLPITVLGGDYGDIPLEANEKAGEFVARLIVEEKISVVLDLSRFRKGEQTSFMIGWAETLYRLNREPLHLFIDEADAWAPQRPVGNLAPRLLGAMEDLVRRGRARGLGITMITQRSASINKDLLTQIEVLIAKRTIAPQDREAIEAWVRVHGTPEQQKIMMASLPALPVNAAWFWSPGWLDLFKCVNIRKLETLDSSATPEVGKRRIEPRKLADVDLETLREKMAATIEKAKAEDPRELRKKIAELERELKAKPGKQQASDGKEFERGYERGKGEASANARRLCAEPLKRARRLFADMEKMIRGVENALPALAEALMDIEATAPDLRGPQTTQAPPHHAHKPPQVSRAPHPVFPPRTMAENNGHVQIGDSGLRRMLIALAQRPQGLNAKQLGVRAGLSSRSGTFSTYLGRLRSSGWVEGGREKLTLTREGETALGSYDPLPEGRDLLSYWLGELGESGAGRMLRALAEHGPMSAEKLGEVAGISPGSGTFSTYLGKLRTLELISGSRSELKASEELFD